MALGAIRKLDAGGWFADEFAGERVPSLGETLQLCCALGLGANVEIKAERGRGAAAATAVAAHLDDMAETLPPILISSFLQDAVAAAAARAPATPRGILFGKVPRDWANIGKRLGCSTIHASHTDLTEAVAAEIIGAGFPLLAYTVNDAARARQLFGWGIASVFSDAPDIILAAIGEDGIGARRGGVL